MGHWRVIRLAESENGSPWADALGDSSWQTRARHLKADRGSSVHVADFCGRRVVVKCWSMRGLKRRVQQVISSTRGLRHWAGAVWLSGHGIATASPVALLRGHRAGSPVECLVMEFLDGRSVLEHLGDGDLSPATEHALARCLGVQIHRIVSLGRFNRDHKPSNLIVTSAEADHPEVAIIDCGAIRRRGANRKAARERMLAMLLIEAIGCRCPPRRTLRLRAALAALGAPGAPIGQPGASRPDRRTLKRELRGLITAVDDRIARHGDPTPRVNPLPVGSPVPPS